MTLTICLWVYSKIRLQLWQATKYCKCINNFNLRNMTFISNIFFMTGTQHSALNIHFLISGRQLHMVSVEVCNILCSCTNYMVLLQPKAWVCNILCHWSLTSGAFLNYPNSLVMQNSSRYHLMCINWFAQYLIHRDHSKTAMIQSLIKLNHGCPVFFQPKPSPRASN